MTTPDKCPKCGANFQYTDYLGAEIYTCKTMLVCGFWNQNVVCLTRQRDQLLAEVTELRLDLEGTRMSERATVSDANKMLEEIAELTKDRERLDFISSRKARLLHWDFGAPWECHVSPRSFFHSTIRGAIDAAIVKGNI